MNGIPVVYEKGVCVVYATPLTNAVKFVVSAETLNVPEFVGSIRKKPFWSVTFRSPVPVITLSTLKVIVTSGLMV